MSLKTPELLKQLTDDERKDYIAKGRSALDLSEDSQVNEDDILYSYALQDNLMHAIATMTAMDKAVKHILTEGIKSKELEKAGYNSDEANGLYNGLSMAMDLLKDALMQDENSLLARHIAILDPGFFNE